MHPITNGKKKKYVIIPHHPHIPEEVLQKLYQGGLLLCFWLFNYLLCILILVAGVKQSDMSNEEQLRLEGLRLQGQEEQFRFEEEGLRLQEQEDEQLPPLLTGLPQF